MSRGMGEDSLKFLMGSDDVEKRESKGPDLQPYLK